MYQRTPKLASLTRPPFDIQMLISSESNAIPPMISPADVDVHEAEHFDGKRTLKFGAAEIEIETLPTCSVPVM